MYNACVAAGATPIVWLYVYQIDAETGMISTETADIGNSAEDITAWGDYYAVSDIIDLTLYRDVPLGFCIVQEWGEGEKTSPVAVTPFMLPVHPFPADFLRRF